MTTYTDFHASECHTTTQYEEPACMAEVKPAPKFARATAPKSTAPRSDYPVYLLRSYGNGLVETL